MTGASRVIVVSNRLPVTLKIEATGATLVPSSGGLATALRSWHQRVGGPWVGWSGHVGSLDSERFSTTRRAMADQGVVPVELTEADVAGYYEGFSNGVLWPLCHYLLDRVPVSEHDWQAYQSVNVKFADAVAATYRLGDVVWVHDYHLMLVPRLLRERIPNARIAFFLHVPFPSSEVFRILPRRTELLDGVPGADCIGLHTWGYVRHLSMSVLHILGIEPDLDRLRYKGRDVMLKAMPIGIDGARFAAEAATPEVQAEAEAIRRGAQGRRILLGIDRLDYTKGLPRRLLALERLLARPEWRDQLRLIQIAVPTRDRVESYRGFKHAVEQTVGRINGEYGTIEGLPVHYLHGTIPFSRLVALYLAADVMVVTPLRDGLNLVAKEFIASRVDEDGVLVLSEFAGAAAELGEAIIVNPYDVDGLTDALEHALTMPAEQRTSRMRPLRARVLQNSIDRWADDFIAVAEAVPHEIFRTGPSLTASDLHRELSPLLLSAKPLVLVLDYDGTLQPIAPTPALAFPDDELLPLLHRVAGRPSTLVHIISGRPRHVLERWLGSLPVELWAEHGFWHRPLGSAEWTATAPLTEGWWARVEPIVERFTIATPGSAIERKTASLAWHYRLADPEFGARQAHELRMLLGDALSNQPLEVREGKKVLEICLRGANKGLKIEHILRAAGPTAALVAVGDDVSDEDLFAVLPRGGVAVHVGDGPSRADYRLAGPQAVRAWLNLCARSQP